MRRRQRPEDEAEINITPMLDIVFIMLIFFIVTTSFVREQGLDISRPQRADTPPPTNEDAGQIVVQIDQLSQITINDRPVDDQAVRANLERERASKPKAPMIVASHPDADTNSLVLVLDAANVVGISNISVATTK